MPAVDVVSFENAYRDIGRQLGVGGINDDDADVKSLIKKALSKTLGCWLLIVDNADDTELVLARVGCAKYFPFGRRGSILFTTRNHKVAAGLCITPQNLLTVAEIDETEAIQLFKQVTGSGASENGSIRGLVRLLAYLPLAVRQASAYINKTRMSATTYLNLCESSNDTLIKLLSKDFGDRGRYENIKNPVATTWLISFQDNPLTTQYLRFICFLAEKEIP